MRTQSLVLTLLCTTACQAMANQHTILPLEDLTAQARGVWISDGYGYVLEIDEDISLYHLAGDICVAHPEALESPLVYFDGIRVDASVGEMDLTSNLEPHSVTFRSQAQLPSACHTPASGNGLINFDAFEAYFERHYTFFGVHGIDWATEIGRARPEAPAEGMALIEPMIGLLSQIEDGHVSLSATVDGEEGQFIAYPGQTLEGVYEAHTGEGSPMAAFGEQFLRRDIERDILGGHGRNAANERIKFGVTSDDIGYMAIMAVGGFTAEADASARQESEALEVALDEVISFFTDQGVKAVIVDLSVNQGGYDFLGRQIAERFVTERTLAYSKFAGDAEEKAPTELYLEPSSRPSFNGPLYVLTSDVTVSAAETLTLAFRALPQTTHVGARTRGALSDVLTKPLPNGWIVTLSNEVYLDHQNISWEGRGIEPDIEWQVFDPENPLSGHLPSIERTVRLVDQE